MKKDRRKFLRDLAVYSVGGLALGGVLVEKGLVDAIWEAFFRPRKRKAHAQAPQQRSAEVLHAKRLEYQLGPNADCGYLMSDEEFTDTTFITEQQMQGLLEEKVSVLAQEHHGVLFSKEAYAAAQHYGLNPLVLLARVQTEKSLVGKRPKNLEKSLRECMGYDIPDSGRRREATLGYKLQIWKAAECLKGHFDAFAKKDDPTVKVNNRRNTVKPKNAATYSLMRYTPWTIEGCGNRLQMAVYKGYRKKLRPDIPIKKYDPAKV